MADPAVAKGEERFGDLMALPEGDAPAAWAAEKLLEAAERDVEVPTG